MIESMRREFLLDSELTIGLPEGSIIVTSIPGGNGEEVSALRVIGGTLHPPIKVLFRLYNRPLPGPVTVTFASVSGEIQVITLPDNSSIQDIKLEPLMAETAEQVKLEPVSNSMLKQIFSTP